MISEKRANSGFPAISPVLARHTPCFHLYLLFYYTTIDHNNLNPPLPAPHTVYVLADEYIRPPSSRFTYYIKPEQAIIHNAAAHTNQLFASHKMSSLSTTLSMSRLSSAFRSKQITPLAALDFCLERAYLSESTHKLNTMTFVHSRDTLVKAATASTKRYQDGTQLSPIDGVPVSVKANIAYKDHTTSACSRILAEYKSPIQADVISRLVDAGAIIIGQTNMDEFGMGSANTNSAFGPAVNSHPYLSSPSSSSSSSSSSSPPMRLSPGGSSGGSASSVAFRSSFASIGTDTGGSVRLPAAYCNVSGFKPSYGSIPRHGVIAYASSLDTVGLIAPTPECTKLLHDVLRGPSPTDPTSLPSVPPSSAPPSPLPLSSYTFGLPTSYSVSECHEDIKSSWASTASLLTQLGATVTPFDDNLTTIQDSLAAYYVIACAEASSNLARYDGIR